MKTHTAQDTREFIHQSVGVRCYRVASAPATLKSSQLQIPNFFPTEPHGSSVALNWLQFTAELASALILSFFVSISGSPLLGLLLPATLVGIEYLLVPLIKYPALLHSRVMAMRAFASNDRHAHTAFTHESLRWRWNDWLVLLVVMTCFAIKAGMLWTYGTFQPQAFMIFNWLVAFAGIGIHLNGLPSRVFSHYRSRWLDNRQRKNRLQLDAERAVQEGTSTLGDLDDHEFRIICSVPLRTGEVDGHRLVQEGEGYVLYCKGILDDSDRTAFIHRQRTTAAQAELAKELVRVQLEMLGITDIKALKEESAPSRDSTDSVSQFPTALVTGVSCLIACLTLASCDSKSMNFGAGKTAPQSILVTQPSAADAVTPVVKALHDKLKARATATNGAATAAMDLQILQADGTLIKVPAPTPTGLSVSLFGAESPAAREQKLEGHLTALETKLKQSCGGKSVDAKTLKAAQLLNTNANRFVVWAAAGGANPWTAQDKGPAGFFDDGSALDAEIDGKPVQSVLVLTEAMTLPVFKTAKPVAMKPVPTKPDAKTKPEPAAPKVVETKEVPSTQAPTGEAKTPQVIMQPGGSVIVNVGRDSENASAAGTHTSIDLPTDAEPIGAPVLFGRGKPTPVNKMELERIWMLIKELKVKFDFRIVITSRADAERGSTEQRNQELSEQRANVCKAFMLEHGIPVHQTICIGDALAESTADHERQVSFYVIDKVERKLPDAVRTANR